jgi:hypothetical protein
MSPAAQRLWTESSRWWPREDGGLSFRIEAAPDEADALRELSEVLSAGFGLHLDEGAEPVHEPDVAHGGGLSFAEFQEFLRSRRARSAAVT